jgi:hypothetical protein
MRDPVEKKRVTPTVPEVVDGVEEAHGLGPVRSPWQLTAGQREDSPFGVRREGYYLLISHRTQIPNQLVRFFTFLINLQS